LTFATIHCGDSDCARKCCTRRDAVAAVPLSITVLLAFERFERDYARINSLAVDSFIAAKPSVGKQERTLVVRSMIMTSRAMDVRAIGTLASANPQGDGRRRYSWAVRLGSVVSKRLCGPLKLAFAGKQVECCSAHAHPRTRSPVRVSRRSVHRRSANKMLRRFSAMAIKGGEACACVLVYLPEGENA
jgi:hypothetical protein